MKKYFVLLCASMILMIVASSCNKNKFLKSENAKIIDIQGDCRFVIQVDFDLFQPRNLPDTLQIDGQLVSITYKLLDRGPQCFGTLPVRDVMHLQTIKRIP